MLQIGALSEPRWVTSLKIMLPNGALILTKGASKSFADFKGSRRFTSKPFWVTCVTLRGYCVIQLGFFEMFILGYLCNPSSILHIAYFCRLHIAYFCI